MTPLRSGSPSSGARSPRMYYGIMKVRCRAEDVDLVSIKLQKLVKAQNRSSATTWVAVERPHRRNQEAHACGTRSSGFAQNTQCSTSTATARSSPTARQRRVIAHHREEGQAGRLGHHGGELGEVRRDHGPLRAPRPPEERVRMHVDMMRWSVCGAAPIRRPKLGIGASTGRPRSRWLARSSKPRKT